MPIAAVPAYLGQDFTEATPAQRFGLLLPIWTTRRDQEQEVQKRAQARSREGQEITAMLTRDGMDTTIRTLRLQDRHPLPGLWDRNDFAARDAWSHIKALTNGDKERMRALAERQTAMSGVISADGLLRLDALAIAPFTTGLGNEHPLENGFAFLNPYGLPYLPGSGVKGVLRQAARELASGDWGDRRGWDEKPSYSLMETRQGRRDQVLDKHKRPVLLSMLDVLFGREASDGDTHHIRGALSFWDVLPQIAGNSLMVEIMTPHQSHYYQWKRDQRGDLIEVGPHESGQPNPISFLTVPPKSRFVFHVLCDLAHLQRLAPNLVEGGRWKELLEGAFQHAFDWLGFGAKTAVGYGAMERDKKAESDREAERRRRVEIAREEQAKREELENLTPVVRAIHEFLAIRPDKNQSEISTVIAGMKQGTLKLEKQDVANWLMTKMQDAKEWKEVSQAKKPEKDKAYQNTLLVKKWLQGN